MSRVLQLKRVAYIDAGQSPPSSEVSDLVQGMPFLQGNAEFGRVTPSPLYECESAPKHAAVGDILLSVRAPVGALNVADRPYGIGRGLASIRPREADGRFIWWWLHSQRAALDAVSTGTTYRAVVAEDVGELPFPQINSEEQRLIADFLDAETARVDEVVVARRHHRELLNVRLRNSLVTLLLPGHEADWTVTRLKYLFDSAHNGIWGDEPTGDDQDVVCVRVADFMRDQYRADPDAPTVRHVPSSAARSRILHPGDVLLEKSGGGDRSPVGFAVSFDSDKKSVCSNFVAALRVTNGVNSRFACLLLAAHYRSGYNLPYIKQSTGIQNLDGNAYLSQQVSIPSYEEQKALAQQFDQELDEVTTLRWAIDRQLALLAERRQALITAAVTGQIDVTTARGIDTSGGVSA